ncbi:MAG: hypothetical protein ACP5MB_10675, partial [bacterium]
MENEDVENVINNLLSELDAEEIRDNVFLTSKGVEDLLRKYNLDYKALEGNTFEGVGGYRDTTISPLKNGIVIYESTQRFDNPY